MGARVLAGAVLAGRSTRTRAVAGRRLCRGLGLAGRRPGDAEAAQRFGQQRAQVLARLFDFLRMDAFTRSGHVLLQPMGNRNTFFTGYLRATEA